MKITKFTYPSHSEYRNEDGRLHREDGPAAIYNNGEYEVWCLNGQLHRIGGPTKIWSNGSEEWWFDGKLHRLDGPAQEWNSGEKGWRIDGEKIPVKSQEEFERYLKLIVFQ